MESEISCTKTLDTFLRISPQKREFYTILLCLNGRVSVKIGYHDFELKSQMVSILAPDTLFSTTDASNDLEVMQLFFHKSFLQKIYFKEAVIDELLLLHADYAPVFNLESSFEEVLNRFIKIEKELQNNAAYHLDVCRLIVVEILYEYNRTCEYCLLGFQKNMNRNYQLTYQYKQLVEQHFIKWRSIGQYAELLGITAKHLTEVIKTETGQTALQILHDRLLLESQYLLKHSTQSIKECAYQLGFDTSSYFTRFFKTHSGISPQDYRTQ